MPLEHERDAPLGRLQSGLALGMALAGVRDQVRV